MIHYTCDRCKRMINHEEKARYIVHIESHPVEVEGPPAEVDEDTDSLTVLHEFLEGLHDEIDDRATEVDLDGQYDLCADCHRQILQNPFGRDAMLALGFSNN